MGDDVGSPQDIGGDERRQDRTTSEQRAGQARLYVGAIVGVVLIGLLVAWVVANRESVEVDWLIASTDAALALVIFVAAALGWLIGLATATAIRHRLRR
jgi:uncharacterized integral membrane protein